MTKDKDTPIKKKLEESDVSRKLNCTMRRLLRMSDVQIRKRFNQDIRRLMKERKRIKETIRRLPPTASESDRKAVARVMQIRCSRLLPHRDMVAVIPDKLKPVRIRAIVRFTGNRADLEAMGIKVRSEAQDVFTIVGTRKQLENLVKYTACRRMSTPRTFFPTVEHASAQAEVVNVQDPRPPINPSGFRGNGVLVGIIDTPLDVTHQVKLMWAVAEEKLGRCSYGTIPRFIVDATQKYMELYHDDQAMMGAICTILLRWDCYRFKLCEN